MTFTRIAYYALYSKPSWPYLHSAPPFTTIQKARLKARKLTRQGYCGWILGLHEMRDETWPDDHWLTDHSADDAIAWLEQF